MNNSPVETANVGKIASSCRLMLSEKIISNQKLAVPVVMEAAEFIFTILQQKGFKLSSTKNKFLKNRFLKIVIIRQMPRCPQLAKINPTFRTRHLSHHTRDDPWDVTF